MQEIGILLQLRRKEVFLLELNGKEIERAPGSLPFPSRQTS